MRSKFESGPDFPARYASNVPQSQTYSTSSFDAVDEVQYTGAPRTGTASLTHRRMSGPCGEAMSANR